jgi:hypothetical protein
MTNQIVSITAIAALFLIGCGEAPNESTSDIAEAQANKEANKNIADARADANETIIEANEGIADAMQTYAQSDAEAQVKLGTAQTDATSERAQANYDLAITTAEENYKVATQKCNPLGGTDRIACEKAAEATLATASGNAADKRDAALLAAK